MSEPVIFLIIVAVVILLRLLGPKLGLPGG